MREPMGWVPRLGVLTLFSLGLAACGMNAEQEELAEPINQELAREGLAYWQVSDLDIEKEKESNQGQISVITYKVDAELTLEKDLLEKRYQDEQRRILVTGTGQKEGKSTRLPTTVERSQLNDEKSYRVELDSGALPQGLTAAALKARYEDWKIIEMGSEAHELLLERLRKEHRELSKQAQQLLTRLSQHQVRLEAVKAELAVLENNAEDVGGLGEPMERASKETEQLQQRVDDIRDKQQKVQDQVASLKDDIKKLQP